ncbi:hypothetical protein BFG06_06375 [Aeromonas caviae]|nr:hypothetical protein BFG06_06375 [Aeromonas caviae]
MLMNCLSHRQRNLIPLAICLLFMRRNGIVNEGLNTLVSQINLQCFTLFTAHNKQMPNMREFIGDIWQNYQRISNT